MNQPEIENKLLEELKVFRSALPPHEIEEMEDLVNHGEPGIAFENLCTQLFEYEVTLSKDSLNTLSIIGRAMKLDPSYWEQLEKVS